MPSDPILLLELKQNKLYESWWVGFRIMAREHMAKWLNRVMPSKFQPVYNLVSFTTTPYEEIVRRQEQMERTKRVLAGVVLCIALLAIAFFIGTFV